MGHFTNIPVFESSVSFCGGGAIYFEGDDVDLRDINWTKVIDGVPNKRDT